MGRSSQHRANQAMTATGFSVQHRRTRLQSFFHRFSAILLVGIFASCLTTLWISEKLRQDQFLLTADESVLSRFLRLKASTGIFRNQLERESLNSSRNHLKVPDGWSRGPHAIFYNIYLPAEGDGLENALSIVQEQLQQIARSPIVRQPLTLNYNLLGPSSHIPLPRLSKWCQEASLNCQLQGVYTNATEQVTLHDMWSFCKSNSDHRVTYLHTKGSFHSSDKNTYWRRLLTAAATSPTCVHPPDETCNLCGLQFFTQFTFFVPGNMFTASCSYVQHLLPPTSIYTSLQEQWVRETLMLRLHNQLRSTLLPVDQLDFWGLDRYADEHWIGSHPNVIPCDLDPRSDIARVFNGTLQESEFAWRMGPRVHGIVGGLFETQQSRVLANPSLRRREILLLPGRLLRWWILYQALPPRSSWVWSFFPDGDWWWQILQRCGGNGSKAVEHATWPYHISMDGSRRFPSSITARVEGLPPTVSRRDFDVLINATSMVFYTVTLHCNCFEDRELVVEQLTMIEKSEAAQSSSKAVPVVIQVGPLNEGCDTSCLDDPWNTISELCAKLPKLRCIKGGSTLTNGQCSHQGQALTLMHDICNKHPASKVVYIHSGSSDDKAVIDDIRQNYRERALALTAAALDAKCWNPVPASCDLCGLSFRTAGMLSVEGTMFSASCDYVQRLVSPQVYQEARQTWTSEMLLRRVRQQSVSTLLPDRPDMLGLDQYGYTGWIASHPTLRPCELFTGKGAEGVSTATSTWESRPNNADVDPHSFIRRPQLRLPEDVMTTERLSKALSAQSVRLREQALLPGLILQWWLLYKELPSWESWIWWSFPDGPTWIQAVHMYGHHAVDHIAAPFAADTF